jgi:hypothetical protein
MRGYGNVFSSERILHVALGRASYAVGICLSGVLHPRALVFGLGAQIHPGAAGQGQSANRQYSGSELHQCG